MAKPPLQLFAPFACRRWPPLASSLPSRRSRIRYSSIHHRISSRHRERTACHPFHHHWHRRTRNLSTSYLSTLRQTTQFQSNNASTTSRAAGGGCGDPICELSSSTLRYGPNATSEVGYDLALMNATRILVFVDPYVRTLDPYDTVMNSIHEHVCKKTNGEVAVVDVYDQIRVEPSNISFQHAIQYMQEKMSNFGPYDAIIALGGGSTIDTAKAANLYACCPPPGDFYDYVNPPLGKGMSIPSQSYLTPLIAIPTTAGTGSETTSVAIFDDVPTRSKTGIANKRLRPTLGIVDPNNMRTLPAAVAKYSGMDVLCHALESYTAIPHWLRPNSSSVSSSPLNRPAYQGSNPISDIWSLHALRECAMYLPRMVNDPAGDEEARSKMCLASSSAGMGFGNAGVHLCHGMSYAVASQVKDGYWTDGYPKIMHDNDSGASASASHNVDDDHHGLVAHGLSVAINAPAVFRFTGKPGQISNPTAEKHCQDRHAECALILHNARLHRLTHDNSSSMTTISEKAIRQHPGEALANELLELMHLLKIPAGLRSLGYNESDVKELARATLPQHRVTKLSPRQPIELEELHELFTDAL